MVIIDYVFILLIKHLIHVSLLKLLFHVKI
jgi:hypothetical protein